MSHFGARSVDLMKGNTTLSEQLFQRSSTLVEFVNQFGRHEVRILNG